jgi:AcrR family transcriptional regulator
MADDADAAGGRPTWRERMRNTATRDIVVAARWRLAQDGIERLTVRAVARDLGMSSPAMYRYFRSHEDLIDAIVLDVLAEITEMLTAVADEGPDATTNIATGATAGITTAERIVRVSRALRKWGLEHPYEFQLALATPISADTDKQHLRDARYQFGRVFAQLYAQYWHENGSPPVLADATASLLQETVTEFRSRIELPVPDALVALFLRCWVRLYGVICMEVMGQLQFLGDEAGAFFEAEMRDLATLMGFPHTAVATTHQT